MSKIVITGIGIIAPSGLGSDNFWSALRNGKTPLSKTACFDASLLDCAEAELIPDFDERAFLDSKTIKYLQRSEKLALACAQLALADAGIDSNWPRRTNMGVVIGSTASHLRAVATFDRQVLCGEASYVDPSLVPSGIMNSLSGSVSIKHGIGGFHVPVAAGEASGLQAIQFALMQLKTGRVEAALAGGVDEICRELYWNYHCRKALSEAEAKPAREQSPPVGRGQSGVTLSEGAALLLLETLDNKTLDNAGGRQAKLYAECAGYSFAYAAGGYSNRESSIAAATRAMLRACEDAEIEPADIDLVFASASGSATGDAIEREAFNRVFQNGAKPKAVICAKLILGESLGASGALQAAAAALSIHRSVIPQNESLGEESSEPHFARRDAGSSPIKHALINSFSSDGHISCLVLSRVAR